MKTCFVLICSLALACAANGQVPQKRRAQAAQQHAATPSQSQKPAGVSHCGAQGLMQLMPGAGGPSATSHIAQGQGKPAGEKISQTSSQRGVTADGERTAKVDPRQLMRQGQRDPSTETRKNMKGSRTQQAADRPETMDQMMRIQHYHDENVTGLKEVGKPRRSTTERELMDKMAGGRRDAKLDKPTFGEKFMMGLKKSTFRQPAGKTPSGAAQGQGKPAGGKKVGEKVSPTPRPR